MTDLPPADAAGAEARTLRRRLQWLMAGRLVVASFLLGGTLLLAVEPDRGFEGFTPRTLLLLIAATFGMTLALAIRLLRSPSPRAVAGVQLAWDVLLVTGLVYVSGGVASVFTFLYGVAILAAAIVVGPRATQATGVAAVLFYVVTGTSVANGWLPHPPDQEPARYLLDAEATGFALMTNVVGLMVVTLLAGNLAGRLRRAGGELRRAAEDVASLARLNDDIVRSLGSGLLTTDLEGRVRTANPAAAAMFRTSAESLVGKPVSSLLPVEDGPPSNELSEPRGEGTARRPDGTEFPIGYARTPLVARDGEVGGALITFQDLTEIAELRAAAERAERLAALGRLAAGLAHEIRNPLSSISGSVQLVRESPLDEEDARLLGIVLAEVERLDDLVTTMLQVGRPKEPVRATADLARLVGDVVEMARTGPAESRRVRIDYAAPDEPVHAHIDADQVRQVVWNLLKNALEASPADRTVTVTVAPTDDGGATVEVRDEGPGIDAKTRRHLFETFYSGRPHGVGLGLALVEQIAGQHGATVEVESDPGHGATFRVRFAAARPSEA